jgi:hypothetical protein
MTQDVLEERSLDKHVENQRVKSHLEALSLRLLNTFNTRDYDNPLLQHLSEKHLTKEEGTVVARTRQEFFNSMRDIVTRNPEMRAKVMYIACDVEEELNRATVWVTMETTGYVYDNLSREAIKVLHWRKREDAWECTFHDTIRGSGVLS